MKPTRRVLLAIAVLLLSMATVLLISWRQQTKTLSAALVTDIEATLARTITRNPKLEAPKHENGYACLSAVVDAGPGDLGPFELKNSDAYKEVMDAGVVPAAWQPELTRLAPFGASVLSCGDSAELKFAPGLTPFDQFGKKGERGSQVVLAVAKLTRLQIRLLALENQWDEVVDRCAATLEVAFDRSHLGLVSSMIASSQVRQLLPSCGEALQHLGPSSRERAVKRFGALPARLAANHEYLDLERQVMSLETNGWMIAEEDRVRLPAGDHLLGDSLENPALRFVLARTWHPTDRAMRALIAVADVPGAARAQASRELDEVNAGCLTEALTFSPSYEKFLVRSDETRVLLQLLVDLAEGGEKPLPTGVTRTAAGLEITDTKGELLIIPVVAGPP